MKKNTKQILVKPKQKVKSKTKQKVKIQYKARPGSPFKSEDVQRIGEEVYSIKNRNPVNIVEFAKNPKSTLHRYFDWNDSVAGEKWRIQQARNIVSHIVEYKIIEGKKETVKSFFPVVSETRGRIYVPHQEATTNLNYRKQLLDQMKSQLENLIKIIGLFSTLEKR